MLEKQAAERPEGVTALDLKEVEWLGVTDLLWSGSSGRSTLNRCQRSPPQGILNVKSRIPDV
jgi:hypothetical protein